MPAALRHTLLSLRDLWASAAPFVLLALLLLTLAYWWLDPMPPRRITLATGPAQSAYDELGKRYAQVLAGYGMAGGKKRSLLHMLVYATVMAGAVYVIMDLEYPRGGLIRIDAADQTLVDVRNGMK